MMLTIHGLPLACKYHDLKLLIKQECNLSDFILDNLVGDGDASKKVRIGVADESEGTHLMKCLDGFRMAGNVLRVMPVAKPPMNQPHSNFDQRGGYPPRNDMPNQSSNYGNQPMAPMGNRPSPWAQNNNQWSPNQSGGPQRSQNNFGYQQQPNQPYQHQQQQPPPQRPDLKQFSQRDMRGRMPQEETGYGFPQKATAPDPGRRMLRSVDIVPGAQPPHQGQAPQRFHNEKPVTINKDYFQGSSQFGGPPGNQPGHFQPSGQNQPSQWGQPPQQQKPPPQFGKPQFEEDRKYPPLDKRPILQKPEQDARMPGAYKGYEKPFLDSSHGRRVSPPGRRVSPPGRRVSPPARRVSPPGRRVSPPVRRVSPPARRVSPQIGRLMSDGRRVSPHARPGSPQSRMPDRRMSPGRRVSPSGRRMSPGRRISPNRRVPGRPSPHHDAPRKLSPHKRFSPSRRLVSPSRHAERFSPSRRPVDKMDKFPDSRASKLVRPAYEPEATNQAMYSGGYRPSLHENVQYPVPGARVADQRSSSSWQQERDKAMFAPHVKKKDEERRDGRPIVTPRGVEHRVDSIIEPKRPSPLRKSRSPSRRDGRERSPLRDRYRRHSPSPRSPRRSWALEKRRSPDLTDAPPPPIWPGQTPEETFNRPNFPDRPEKEDPKKHPSWDRRQFNDPAEEVRRDRRPAPETRPFNPPGPGIRIRTDLGPREPMPPNRNEPPRGFKPPEERYSPKLHEPRFEPREEYKEQRDYRRPENVPERKNYPEREEFRDFQRGEDRDRRREEFPRRDDFRREERKEPFPRRDERPDQRKDHDMFQKEFEDIYKRAKEFKQKVEELRRPDRRDEYRDDHRRDLERGDERRKMLDDHSRERRDEARLDYRHPDADRLRDERPRSHQSDEYSRQRELDWKNDKSKPPKPINQEAQAKRDKAAEEIATKILERHGNFGMSPDVRSRILKELVNVVLRIINNMFGYKDVSFIETVIKFNAKHTDRDEYKIFQDVMGNFPNLPKAVKRHGEDDSEIPAKTSKRSPEKLKQGSRSSYIAERSARPKPQRVPPVRRSVARPEVKPRVAPTRALHGANADGAHELGPRTYRMLKAELDHLMFSVERYLPNTVDLTCDAERDIVERWRNEMGDNLKDVLGLNATQRLLNVFNPLNVKVHFTTKPDRKYLSSFLKRYHFVAFKRLAGVVNTFAAQVRDIADFDALCTARSVHCGAAKITISPFYRFTQCPKKVRTVFCNPDYINDKRRNNLSDKVNKTKDDSFTSTKSEEAIKSFNTDVIKESTKVEPVKPTTNKTLNVEDQKTNAKTTALTSTKTSVSKVDINVETATPKVETPKPKVETPKPKVETPKPKVETPKPKVETPNPKVETPKPKVEAPKQVEPSIIKIETPASKVEAPKTIIKTPTAKVANPKPKVVAPPKAVTVTPAPKPVPVAKAQIPISAPESDKAKPKVDKPVEPVKSKIENKQQVDSNKTVVLKTDSKVDDKTKNTVKVAVQTKNVANVKASPAKAVAKLTTSNTKITKGAVTAKHVPAKKNIFPNKKATKKAIEKDDYEELDDHDILALISEGIVLDECSGSDED